MSAFEEAYRKVIAEGLAKWTLRSIAGIFSLSLTALLLGYTTLSAAILVVALFLTLLLAAYVFGWVSSYRKTRQRIDDLEHRVAANESKNVRDLQEIDKKIEAAAKDSGSWI